MNTATWKSIKSPVMQEIRIALKGKAEKGQPTPSRKEANRVWREEILGILSEDQRKERKAAKQKASEKRKIKYVEDVDETYDR
jgi:hypothetical protein